MIKKLSLSLILGLLGSALLNAETVIYKIDSVHSGIDFKIRHFINKMPGSFATFSGEIHFDKDAPGNSKAIAEIAVSSVNTRNADRDEHLQNEDFFNAGSFPTMTFTSTEWKATGENTYAVTGMLEMLGIKKPVTLDVTFLGEVEGRGAIRSGWEGKATIDRTDWGMGYGTPSVGTEVEIELNIQAHRQAEEA